MSREEKAEGERSTMEREVSTRARATCILVIALAWATFAYAQEPQEDAVFQIGTYRPPELLAVVRGTAWHGGGGMFYTAAHSVVRRFLPEGGRWYLIPRTATEDPATFIPAEVRCVHPKWRAGGSDVSPHDVAALAAESHAVIPALVLSGRGPQVGEDVRVLSYAETYRRSPRWLFRSRARVMAVRDDGTFTAQVMGGFVLDGASGAPVLNAEGLVVGIVNGGSLDRRGAAKEILGMTSEAVRTVCQQP